MSFTKDRSCMTYGILFKVYSGFQFFDRNDIRWDTCDPLLYALAFSRVNFFFPKISVCFICCNQSQLWRYANGDSFSAVHLSFPLSNWRIQNKNPRMEMRGISFSGITLNFTGCAQVRFLLACQPCIGYLLPVNGSRGSNMLSCSLSLSCFNWFAIYSFIAFVFFPTVST